ncbi:MAG: hypothetical protein DELT_00691 [Desulfovibrio sp.]
MLEILPHIFGIACLLYSLQLLNLLRLDLKGKRTGDGLLAVLAGILSLIFTATVLIGLDMVLPFDGTVSEAMFFVRVTILIPLAYLVALITSHILRTIIGSAYPQSAVSHVAFLGVTLFFLAPAARKWIQELARLAF